MKSKIQQLILTSIIWMCILVAPDYGSCIKNVYNSHFVKSTEWSRTKLTLKGSKVMALDKNISFDKAYHSSDHFSIDCDPLTIKCPKPIKTGLCQSQSDLNTEYNEWLNALSYTGTGPFTININNNTPPDACTAGIKTVEFTVTDQCNNSVSCTSTFEIINYPLEIIDCPENELIVGSYPLSSNEIRYKKSFLVRVKMQLAKIAKLNKVNNINCSVYDETTFTLNECSGLATGDIYLENACGDPILLCHFENTYVAETEELIINCPVPHKTGLCQSQADLNTEFNTWLNSLSYSGTGPITVTIDDNIPPDACEVGIKTVAFTVTDVCGKTASCSSTFEIIDPLSLNYNCEADDEELLDCPITIFGRYRQLFQSEPRINNLKREILNILDANNIDCELKIEFPFTNDDCSGTITAHYYLENACGDPITLCQFTRTFTVIGTVPVFTSPEDITIHYDANCEYNVDPSETGLPNDISEYCEDEIPASFSYEDQVETNEGITIITRTWTAISQCGQVTTGTQQITVIDNTPPTAVCQDLTINMTGNSATITTDDIDDGSYDNCSEVNLAISKSTFTCKEAGEHTVTLTVTDAEGNSSTCLSIVTIGPDADCDGVTNSCDVCPGGDDSIDNNNDGLPDCKHPPAFNDIIIAWKCGNNNTKVSICHIPPGNPNNAHTICVSYNAIAAHMAHGDYLGPCGSANCNNNSLKKLDQEMESISHVEENEHHDVIINITPNPNHGMFTLSIDGVDPPVGGQGILKSQVSIIDPMGKEIYSLNILTSDHAVELPINLEAISAGQYLIKFSNERECVSKKMILIR